MGARVWNNAGNYDANVALVQKFYARTRCTMKRTPEPPEHFPRRVDSGWRRKGCRPISCAYSTADKPFCGIPACLAKQGRLLAAGSLLGFDRGNRGHVENAARGHR